MNETDAVFTIEEFKLEEGITKMNSEVINIKCERGLDLDKLPGIESDNFVVVKEEVNLNKVKIKLQ